MKIAVAVLGALVMGVLAAVVPLSHGVINACPPCPIARAMTELFGHSTTPTCAQSATANVATDAETAPAADVAPTAPSPMERFENQMAAKTPQEATPEAAPATDGSELAAISPLQLREGREGKIVVVAMILTTCCSAQGARNRLAALEEGYAQQDVATFEMPFDQDHAIDDFIAAWHPQWAPTEPGSRPVDYVFVDDGGSRLGPGVCFIFGRDGYLAKADIHTSDMETAVAELLEPK